MVVIHGASGPSITGLHTTSARIGLPTPIAPKATATIDVEWHYKLAGGNGSGHRMTYRWGDTLYQVAQWYPRVAVYDDLRGWDTDPYLGPSEFYNNFGHFDVTLDVPAGWIVGATGVLQNPDDVLTPTARERLSHVLESDSTRTIVGADRNGDRAHRPRRGDRLIWHFVADTVDDFAWATSNHSSGMHRARPFRAGADSGQHSIPARVTRSQFAQAGRFSGTRSSSTRSSGCRTRFRSSPWSTVRSSAWNTRCSSCPSDGAADHETGHQWWPMMVERKRNVVRLDGRGLQSIHEHSLRRRPRRQAAEARRPRQSYGAHQWRRARSRR